jgi:hypothetical protein
MEQRLIREVESEEFFETTLEETEIFELKEKKEKDKVILE